MKNTGPAKPPTRAAKKKSAKKAAKKKTTKKVASKKASIKKAAAGKDGKTLSGPGSEKRGASKPTMAKSGTCQVPVENSTDPLKMPEEQARKSLKRVYELQGEVDRMTDRADSAKMKHDAAKQQLKDAEKALHEELHQQKEGAGPLFGN